MDFNGLIPALQAGRADFVMAGMTPTAERKKMLIFLTFTTKLKIQLSPIKAAI
jgi:ABC-type amino acid transport/signal transduction systems, periplasmic component/domain